jgi:hypothetical protein
MSRKNGDRARSDRQRNEKIHKRTRIRQLRKALAEAHGTTESVKGTASVVL